MAFVYDSSNGFVYAADEGTNEITVINGTTNTVNETIGAYHYASNGGYFTGGEYNGQQPWGLAFIPSSNYLYAANYGSGNVTVIDCTKDQVVGFVNVGLAPRGMAYDATNGYIYVANHFGDTVTIIST